MQFKDFLKKIVLPVSLLVFSLSALAKPARDVAINVNSDGFGDWLLHQLSNADFLLTGLVCVALIALTGGGAVFRRRRSRRPLLPG